MNLVTDLAGAVSRGEFVALYQPQVDVRNRRMVGVEALARWNHPQHGLISPTTFVPLAEHHDLIAEIGDFMIDEGCRCASQWNALGRRVDVAVNVSAAQLVDLAFLDRVAGNLERYALSPDRLVIEITESLPFTDVPDVSSRLRHLRGLGLGISIDDFGTGYSSLSRLATVPATEIKIDQSLIQSSSEPTARVRDAVDTAHDLGIRVVAEGVETEAQFVRARTLGCDRAQGFLFSRPTTALDITRLLAAG